MNTRRDATKTIWKTVVFAGAMLGSAACSKPAPATTTPDPNANVAPNPCGDVVAEPGVDEPNPCATAEDPCADPCGDRVRGVSDEGDVGRGFVLS